jgi:hypothetical protein
MNCWSLFLLLDPYLFKETYMTICNKRTLLALALAGSFGAANATTLATTTGDSANISSSVDMVASFFGGTMLDSAITTISTPGWTGTARMAVYDTGSGLDFYYQFTNDSTSKTGLERFAAYDFSPLAPSPIDVYQTNAAFGIFTAGTEAADYADRTSKGVIGFSFVPNGQSKINPGTTSFTTIIRTNAHDYKPGNFALIDGYSANATAFAPAVPEPETYAMMLAGLGVIGFIGKRRRAK